ncbi:MULTISPECIES: GlxA family transcriptional regulator [unclassified Pantoea]|uniref:GlxA family transcriptional regulator n=1 Tax=unclassified Pantoea TaxID=2630326 RepID=UPI001CD5855D|nr:MULTISPECIES: helix-turn-helix domain-containing protein [unclassified Pantoea]MCA1179817.1 helix-turn-helix domain-containing protein [Pantoea sp. alder69]MCA1253581.1 helix-turn-helix domain-containing protein [Pantoea sp. alder70]MCA1268303.1 helix-turn-helix domain-containing protein [Pantoea sp. alder81]
MRIAILALEGSVLSAISGLTDMFWITNKAIESSPLHASTFHTRAFKTLVVSSDGAPVWDAEGRLIHIDSSFKMAGKVDVVIAPGMLLGHDLQPINIESIKLAAEWFRTLYNDGTLVAGAGTGSVVLGEAGLLDERSYSTTWWVSHMLQERYPQAHAVKGKKLEEDRGVITTGGCFSWISLALHIIEKGAGSEVARLTTEMSLRDNDLLRQVLFPHPSNIDQNMSLLIRAQEFIRFRKPSITASELAEVLGMTERTLQRRIKKLSQETPKEFITRVRVEMACTMLVSTNVSIHKVAQDCGYTEDTAFRKAFNQLMDMSPAQYREWMKTKSLQVKSSINEDVE